MFKYCRMLSFLLFVLLINVQFLVFPNNAFADDGGLTNTPSTIARNTKASNPNCQSVRGMAEAGLIAVVAIFLVSFGLYFIPPPYGITAATATVAGALATLIYLVTMTPMYFACNWSFVRHPVMRFDINDDSGQPGRYKTCKNPKPNRYPSCADEEYWDESDYFKCIANGTTGCKKDDVECGRKNEPMCPDEEFVGASKYAWPKNRISSSEYIEFCYRLPIGVGVLPPVLLTYIIDTETRGGPVDYFRNRGTTCDNASCFREAEYANNDIKRAKAYIRGGVQCATLRANEKKELQGITFQAVERSDKLCVDGWGIGSLPLFPNPEIGCQMRPSGPPAPMCEKSVPIEKDGKIVGYDNSKCFNCYISSACYGEVTANIKSPFPVTSVIVQCIRESFDNLLTGKGCGGEDGFLTVAQKKLKNAVKAALILALILFAVKAALGGVQNSAEVYLFGLKVAVILYLTTGDVMGKYYGYLTDISVGLSDLVLQAGGNQTVCNYDQSEYNFTGSDGRVVNLGYLAPWDRLDCRMMFYFGSQLTGNTAGSVFALLLGGAFVFLAILLGLQVLVCLMALFAVIMIILIVMWMMYLFILSFIALTLLCLFAPLFLPMMLFQVTRNFFDGWLRELITYTLYPVILFAFLSLIFSVFDNLYFEGLNFKRQDLKVLDANRITFVLDPENACNLPENSNNLACMVTSMTFGETTTFLGLKFTNFSFDRGSTEEIWTKLFMMALMGFLFYHFLNVISSLAAELAGNPRADLAGGGISPKEMMGKVMVAASKVKEGVHGAAKNAYNKTQSRGTPGDQDSISAAGGEEGGGAGDAVGAAVKDAAMKGGGGGGA